MMQSEHGLEEAANRIAELQKATEANAKHLEV